VLQFGFAILLMVGTLVIFQQMDLVKSREIGYDRENLIQIDLTDELTENYDILKQDLLQSGVVASVTRSNSPITQVWSNNFLGWPGKPEDHKVMFVTISADYDYTKTMGIEVLQGRDFSKDFATDTASIIINKAALDLMNMENPIGTSLDLWGEKVKLIGVIDNVLMGSPYEAMRPSFIVHDIDWMGIITVRLKKTNDLSGSLASMEKIFNEHNPAYPFEYEFADVDFERKFTTIQLTQKLGYVFTFLAIFITGLGLFGLASYTAAQRIKKIGIRKVLGASVVSIVGLISRDFSKLVLIAFVIAGPLSWYLMDRYLERYTIRIDIQWWILPVVGVVALGFALLIVANHARKAAVSNPIKSLRTE
jgi:hypothetical protein